MKQKPLSICASQDYIFALCSDGNIYRRSAASQTEQAIWEKLPDIDNGDSSSVPLHDPIYVNR